MDTEPKSGHMYHIYICIYIHTHMHIYVYMRSCAPWHTQNPNEVLFGPAKSQAHDDDEDTYGDAGVHTDDQHGQMDRSNNGHNDRDDNSQDDSSKDVQNNRSE
jgi:hypothetical protein